jgi:hypothetical protein
MLHPATPKPSQECIQYEFAGMVRGYRRSEPLKAISTTNSASSNSRLFDRGFTALGVDVMISSAALMFRLAQ